MRGEVRGLWRRGDWGCEEVWGKHGECGKVFCGVEEVRGKVYGGGVRKARGDGGVKKCVWEVRGEVCGVWGQRDMGGVKKCGRSRGTVYGGECGN